MAIKLTRVNTNSPVYAMQQQLIASSVYYNVMLQSIIAAEGAATTVRQRIPHQIYEHIVIVNPRLAGWANTPGINESAQTELPAPAYNVVTELNNLVSAYSALTSICANLIIGYDATASDGNLLSSGDQTSLKNTISSLVGLFE